MDPPGGESTEGVDPQEGQAAPWGRDQHPFGGPFKGSCTRRVPEQLTVLGLLADGRLQPCLY